MPEYSPSEISAAESLSAVYPRDLPWAPWAMPGARFKLLSADPARARFSLLIRFEPGCDGPPHRHVGAVEGLVLEGGFHYAHQPERRFTAGMYLLEQDGAVHHPVSPEGAILFAVFHGPVEGLAADGSVSGRIDCGWHVAAWQRFLASRELAR